MNRTLAFCKWVVAILGAAAMPYLTSAQHYTQTNLVSDTPGLAPQTDPHLRNAWGLSRSAASPWWVSNAGDGTSSLFDGQGDIIPLVVTIPGPKGQGVGIPTGTVFNGTTDFAVAPGMPAIFLFATADGTISGWNPQVNGTNAILKVDNSHKQASYTSLAIGEINGKHVLYVANFHSGEVEVYDANFQRVHLQGDAFQNNRGRGDRFDDDRGKNDNDNDNRGGADFVPFNVQTVGSNLFVTFAKQGPDGREAAGDGLGDAAIFTNDGRLILGLEHGTWFNAPWGIVVAPGDFGEFSHDILVGNLRSGKIAAFNPATGLFRGFLRNADNSVLVIDGLWALAFANNGTAGASLTLYFTAGPNQGKDGLFGTLLPVAGELNLEIRP